MGDTLTSGCVVFTAKLVWLEDKCHGVGCTFITGVHTDILRLWCVRLSFFSAAEALSFFAWWATMEKEPVVQKPALE